jgi:hypothetical protein
VFQTPGHKPAEQVGGGAIGSQALQAVDVPPGLAGEELGGLGGMQRAKLGGGHYAIQQRPGRLVMGGGIIGHVAGQAALPSLVVSAQKVIDRRSLRGRFGPKKV